MNSGKKILISRRASSSKTPETASAAEHFFLFRAALTISFLLHRLRLWFFLSCCGRSSFSCACLYTATELVNFCLLTWSLLRLFFSFLNAERVPEHLLPRCRDNVCFSSVTVGYWAKPQARIQGRWNGWIFTSPPFFFWAPFFLFFLIPQISK